MLKLVAYRQKDSPNSVDTIYVDRIDEAHADPDNYCRLDCHMNGVPCHFLAKRFIISKVTVKPSIDAEQFWEPES